MGQDKHFFATTASINCMYKVFRIDDQQWSDEPKQLLNTTSVWRRIYNRYRPIIALLLTKYLTATTSVLMHLLVDYGYDYNYNTINYSACRPIILASNYAPISGCHDSTELSHRYFNIHK